MSAVGCGAVSPAQQEQQQQQQAEEQPAPQRTWSLLEARQEAQQLPWLRDDDWRWEDDLELHGSLSELRSEGSAPPSPCSSGGLGAGAVVTECSTGDASRKETPKSLHTPSGRRAVAAKLQVSPEQASE
eukprot:TRINITY_DN527_c0_g1_i3.p2 TRINITY_DN527_c0_g1~~TRINITY_DN527_c0_g1_i3.p2  ORF type:complete len:129 (+),score=58.43 TRINITY_DN527_c0_g1_i3:105-491(+)